MKLIIFTTCKPFIGDDAWRQEQAIKSWISLTGIEKKIIIIGNDEGTKEICEKYNLIHEKNIRTLENIPYLDDLLQIGAKHADKDDYLLWTNSDMIFYNEMINNILAFEKIRKNNKEYFKNFSLIGGRMDWHNPKILDNFEIDYFKQNMLLEKKNTTDIIETDSTKFILSKHALCGIDYIIHSPTTFLNKIDKNLVIAGTRHDMILVGTSLENNYFTCNISETNFIIHQNHGYPKNFNHSIDNKTKDKRQMLLNKLISNNRKCYGTQRWIHEAPIFTKFDDKGNIQFFKYR